jgi:signal transduction histidine kinase
MIRRLFGALLAIVVALLAVVAAPLGFATARHERTIYRDGALASARAIAAVAEERLSDREPDPALLRYLRAATDSGDGIVVVNTTGHAVAGAGDVDTFPRQLVSAVLSGKSGSVWYHDDGRHRLAVSVPVISGARGQVGAVVFTRSAAGVDKRVRSLWWRLAAAAAVAALVAALVAVLLTRWVARPLLAVEQASSRLGEGALDSRAPDDAGPPELRRLATAFNRMARRLEGLVHDHTRATADVAHQLRTPLAALRLRIELWRDGAPPAADEIEGALTEVARLSHLVDGLLALARAENADVERVVVDFGAVARERVAVWEPLTTELGVTVECDGRAGVIAVLGRGHLEQILDNLLDNAVTALPGGGRITIAADVAGDLARLTVSDNGPGIPVQAREAALDRFVTTDGTGLGLAVVHRLVTADGGTVELREGPNGGLSVVLAWPGRTPVRRGE